MKSTLTRLPTAAFITANLTTCATAQEALWPFEVINAADGAGEAVSYEGLECAEEPWHVCVLFRSTSARDSGRINGMAEGSSYSGCSSPEPGFH